jgi:glutaredoxin
MFTLHVRIYSRPGCHLCEDALQTLESLRDDYEFLLEEVNIDEDPALKERLGEQIPVVTVDGGNRVAAHITEERLRRAFDRALKARQAVH